MGKHNSVEQYDAAKRAAQEARLEELRNKNFFGVRLQGSYDDGLSTEEIKFLRANNKSFLDVMTTIDGFRKLTAEQQEAFFSEANEATRISLENDGYISAEIQSFAKSPEEAEEIIESRRAAEQTKLFQQSREAEEEIARQEKLYPGVEVVDGKYRLTIDPEDGTAPEVFWGETQAEVWKKLRDSKKNATRELRRRAQQVKITQELRDMQVDVVEYAPLEQKVTLTPAELFEATEMLKDPTTSIEGTRRLQAAARTQADVDRANESLVRGRMLEAQSVAKKWMEDNPQFFVSDHNIGQLRDIMGTLNWAVTPRNMTLAYNALVEQGVLIDKLPDADVEAPAPPVSPRRVFTPQAAPSAPVTPQAARPTPPVRRPLNNTSVSGPSQTRAREEVGGGTARVKAMDATEYASIGATDMRARYAKDPAFRARVDAYWAGGGR